MAFLFNFFFFVYSYRRNYDIDISDGKQPLLVNWPKKRQPDEVGPHLVYTHTTTNQQLRGSLTSLQHQINLDAKAK